MPGPSLSVVMPVRDGAQHLHEALASVRHQSFGDFELIVVDDHSRDETPDILAEHASNDGRIRVLAASDTGVAAALNQGIDAARAPLVARMDADDRSHRDRFATQTAFLRERADIGLVGTAAVVLDADGRTTSRTRHPLHDAALRLTLAVGNPFNHGSTMFRRGDVVAVGGYDPDRFPAEDYDLWCRLATRGTRMANIDRDLYDYRLSPRGVSRVHQDTQQRVAAQTAAGYANSARPPSTLEAIGAVRATARCVAEGRAQPGVLLTESRMLRRAASQWVHSRRVGGAVACLAGAATAEIALGRDGRIPLRQHRSTEPES